MRKKSIFRNKMTEVALSLHTWVEACIRRHIPTHTARVQRYKKCKFSTIMAKVWNESHIIWELFQTPFFPCSKPNFFHSIKPNMVYFQNTQKSHWKNLRFTRK